MAFKILVCVISFICIESAYAGNLWKDHLDGKVTLPPAISQKESNPKKQKEIARKYYDLKKQRKVLRSSFWHKIFKTNKKEIKDLDEEISKTKSNYFKYKITRRISNKQRRAISR